MNSSHAGRGSSPRSEPEVPSLDASRFELLEQIGTGGMGTVYRAVQRSVGRHVAIKMLAPEHAANASGLARFVREANIVARLTHPNLVQLIDFGRDRDGNLLLVMELLEGESLRHVIRRETAIAPERAAYITVQCLNALRVAHAAGVIHRDLKPENIFLHRVGDDDHVKVLDFGVAKLTQGDVGDQHTTQGSLVGTLRYMAPEQVAGETPDARIDVYAMGMVLYELLAGAIAYDTRDRFVLLRQIIAEEPAHLLTRAPDVPAALAEVVMRAIQKTPAQRYANVDEFRRALKPFLAADHARLQSLADATGRPTATGSVTGGEIRSGVVRSEHLHASAVSAGGPSAPGYASAPGYPSAPGYAQVPLPVAPSAPPAPASRASIWPLVAIGVLLLALAAVGGVAFARHSQPVEAPARTTVTTPAPVFAPREEPARATTRMVTVVTTPPGAEVLDAAGQRLCAATPCVVAVPAGQTLPVRLVRGTASLPATLDGDAPSVRIDLSALETPAAPPTPTERPGRRPGRHPTGTPPAPGEPEGGGELPMFLPH